MTLSFYDLASKGGEPYDSTDRYFSAHYHILATTRHIVNFLKVLGSSNSKILIVHLFAHMNDSLL